MKTGESVYERMERLGTYKKMADFQVKMNMPFCSQMSAALYLYLFAVYLNDNNTYTNCYLANSLFGSYYTYAGLYQTNMYFLKK